MTTIASRRATPAKRVKSPAPASGNKPASAERKISAHTAVPSAADTNDGLQTTRVTKHDRILSLLSRRDGTNVPDMMEASGWQQHSVRGFLAGTVKKKLGFTLTSSKEPGEACRYRIVTRRGR